MHMLSPEQPSTAPLALLLLAGGQSSRMGQPIPKALQTLQGKPLIEHVLRRLRPQGTPLWVSVGPASDADLNWARGLGNRVLTDAEARHRGPLAGLHAGLRELRRAAVSPWLLLCPCDAPFVPLDLGSRLLATARSTPEAQAIVAADEQVQPTFSLWHVDALELIDSSLANPEGRGLKQVLEHLPHEVVHWLDRSPPPFFNVNTPEQLEQAEAWLDPDSSLDLDRGQGEAG
jgi:molybdopterin-guanine dinucleotide biosynthesis protein A